MLSTKKSSYIYTSYRLVYSRSSARKSELMQQYDRWTICLTYGITVTEPLANVLLRHLNVHSGGEVFFFPWEAERGPHDCSHD